MRDKKPDSPWSSCRCTVLLFFHVNAAGRSVSAGLLYQLSACVIYSTDSTAQTPAEQLSLSSQHPNRIMSEITDRSLISIRC